MEGKNIVVEYRFADGNLDRLKQLTTELVQLDVDIIVSGGPTATRPAKEATSTIPIVMGFDDDPVGAGFVASLARPGGNITGLSTPAAGNKRKTTRDSKRDISPTIPRGCLRSFDPFRHVTIATRDRTRRGSVQNADSVPGHTRAKGHRDGIRQPRARRVPTRSSCSVVLCSIFAAHRLSTSR